MPPPNPRSQALRHLIVVGASAGGVEAVSELLGALPAGLDAPVVVAQHLSPSRSSHLDEILGRHSPLAVRMAAERQVLDAGVVYVVPASRDAEIEDGALCLTEPIAGRPVPSIDRLLRSAAHEVGEGLMGVILSGSGSDGTAGAAEVKAAGGMIVIQDPASAGFPSMPRSLAPGTVDAAAEPRAIGPLIVDFVGREVVDAGAGDEAQLRRLLDRLHEHSGVDFAGYKRPTVLRRLNVRMVATGRPTLAEYVQLLEDDPEECTRLTASLLIKVTEFFRDTRVMDRLRTQILPDVVARARANHELRVWCAGCATGEEAYTMAILIAEALGDQRGGIDVRVFATDIDASALAVARRGVYTAAAVRKVPPELRERYFTVLGDAYEVAKEVRASVIFGEHDLSVRPPFPHLDMVLCRNVLIYFTAELQRRVLQVFAYALRPGGWLVLGSAESTAGLDDTFVADSTALKIYRRDGPATVLPPLSSAISVVADAQRLRSGKTPARHGPQPGSTTPGSFDRQLDPIVRELPVGVVVVGTRYETLRISPAARRLLGIHGSALGEDFIHLAELLPAGPLRTALRGALKGTVTTGVHRSMVLDPLSGGERHLAITCAPVRQQPDAPIAGAVILVADASAEAADHEASSVLRERLEQARETAERLLAANAEVTEANDRLRIANETLVLGAEDAQAAREEAETLTEELQASNEELETLNEELQASVEELNVANEDLSTRTNELAAERKHLARERDRMASILEGMGDAVLAVDPEGKSAICNRAYRELFGDPGTPFVPEDEVGRPFPSEAWPQERARQGETFGMQFTVGAADGSRRWFEARGSALEERLHEWAGVVVIRDVTDRSLRQLQEAFFAAASHELRTPLAVLHGYAQLLVRGLDPDRDGKAAAYAASVLAQTRRLGELSDRLFDLSLLTERRLSLERELVDLVALATHVAEIEDVLAGEAASVVVQSRRKRLVVEADPGRIEQVLVNLVANSLLHGPATQVIVRVRIVGRRAEVAVIDNGRGIPADEMPRLFGRFSQLGQGHRAARAGLGLGLFLAHEIVAAHGGTIEATSKEEQGTTVTVHLPLRAGGPSR